MRRAEGIAYLTQCADREGKHWYGGFSYSADDCYTCNGTNDASHLRVPCSRYGYSTGTCAPVAWRVAYLIAREQGEEVTLDSLDHAMSLVVNDHDDVAYIVNNYGHGHYRVRRRKMEIGCYVDGHWGQYGAARVIMLAHELGWDDKEAIELASRKLDNMGPSTADELTLDEEDILIDACDDAESWLNANVAEEGHSFGWHDGEFFYWSNSSWEED